MGADGVDLKSDPHDPRLSEAGHPVPRHHHAHRRPGGPPRGDRRAGLPFLTAGIDYVAGIEARGFILGGAVAHELGRGFVPIRKKGKLPWRTIGQEYSLEYGVDTIEIHADAIHEGERVLLVDDLIATGGTAEAAIELIRRSGGNLIAAAFVIDLPDLGGAARLAGKDVTVHTLVSFEGH